MKQYTDISEEWKNDCEEIKIMSEPIVLEEFGLQRMERCLDSEFKVVQYMTQTQKHLEKLYKNPDHFSLNRHSHIMTFNENRPILGKEEHKDLSDNYINANIIHLSNWKCIATQGPMNSTISNFWRLIDEHKVSGIFMFCQKIEKGKIKCNNYWPVDEKILNIEKDDKKLYEVSLIEQIQQKFLKTKKLCLKNIATGETRQVVHHKILQWPDGDKPTDKILKSVKKLLNYFLDFLQKDQTPLVHCSAGVGRTGTFIAMAEIKMMIENSDKISIFEIVRKLREQRWGMVYTSVQYQFLYDFAEKQSNTHFQAKQESDNSD